MDPITYISLDASVQVVDDQPAGDELVAALRTAGHPACVCPDPERARDLLLVGTYPAAVIRVEMQGGRGLDLIREIGPPQGCDRDVAVIAVGELATPSIVAEVLDLGAADFLRSPFAVVEAVARVGAALRWRTAEQHRRAHREDTAPPRAIDIFERLTNGEAAVARRAARGLTNRAIAAELFVSVKAVEFHMGHILQKLALSNRTELAALLAVSVRRGAGRDLAVRN